MRSEKQILKEERIAENKIWYDRHQSGMSGHYKKEKDPKVLKCIKGGIKAAKRWALGEDWGNLDT